jgi:hypothetical protein
MRKMALMSETGFKRDLSYRQLPFCQKRSCALHAPLDNVLMNRLADRTPKRGFAMRHTQSCDFCDVLECQLLAEVILDKGQYLLQAVPGQPSPKRRDFAGLRRMTV